MSSGGPQATILPPPSPPSGPRSITQSAVLMTSRLCSITTTVLPCDTSSCSTSSSFLTSWKFSLAVVGLPLAGIAGDVAVGQEVHLDLDDAVALAGLAAAALDVEGEAAGLVAARLCLRQPREPLADRRERAGIGRGIRARGAPDRRLVDVDDLVDMLQPLDAVVWRGSLAGVV